MIPIEQSNRVARTKQHLSPVPVSTSTTTLQKLTVPRLHFSKTTANNIRRHGKPNPRQQYFSLVVSLLGVVDGESVPLCAMESDNIIVRASNLNIFNETTYASARWADCKQANAIHYQGNVGINSASPAEALSVQGNVMLSGRLLQPSDKRLKTNIEPVDRHEQLVRLRKVNLYSYRLKEEWATVAGRAEHPNEVGVLAQELRDVLPDAVRQHTSPTLLSDGTSIPNLLVVDKERLFMEAVGAVQELASITENLQQRLKALEGASAEAAAAAADCRAVPWVPRGMVGVLLLLLLLPLLLQFTRFRLSFCT